MICGRMLTENEKGMFVQTQDLMALIGLRSRGRRRIVQIIERLEACDDEHENEARKKSQNCFTTNYSLKGKDMERKHVKLLLGGKIIQKVISSNSGCFA